MAASIVHAVSHSYPPPPSFSQESTDSSINGAHLPQPGMQSFDGLQSIASTPTPTPPASRGHHQISSFNTATYPLPNGVPIQQAPPKPYGEVNGVVPQQQYPPGHKPSIYTAVYSSVSVYEMEVNGIAVMRRRSDSWLNATQILKVAGMEKAKRTKVLEKEILNGEHEKVQGGYGKYQGTWINYNRGVAFCRQYGVGEILRPLLEYDMGQDGITIAGRGNINTPTKEQAMAAQRKRNLMSGSFDTRSSPQSQGGTFFSNISKTAATAVNAINKARFDPAGSRGMGNSRPPTQERRPSQQYTGSQESAMGPNSQQSMQSEASFATNTHLDPALRSENPSFLEMDGMGDNERPRKRQRPSSTQLPNPDISMLEFPPAEDNVQFLSPNLQSTLIHVSGLPALPPPVSYEATNKQKILLSLFEDKNRTDFTNHPAILRLSGEDLDIPMDQTAHTAVHWAASLARIELLRTLVLKGASIYRLNSGGETALMRAATTTNNFQCGTFPEVLKLLGTSIEIRDGRGRTVLHHIATAAAIDGRPLATRSYLDSILLYVVGNSNAPNSQQASFAADEDPNNPSVRPIGLARFMSEIVNTRDMAGDTALHLAAKTGNKGIVQQLQEIGADSTIANRHGLKPIDIPGVGGEPKQASSQAAKEDDNPISKFEEAHDQLLELVQTQLSDAKHNFEAERQKKQVLIDAAHSALRENAAQLAIERQRLDELKQKTSESKNLRLRVTNLRRAHDLLKSRHDNRSDLKTNIKIGEADAGLEVEASKLPPLAQSPLSSNAPQQNDYLAYLPPTSILQARAEAYRANNEQLELQIKTLNDQSTELEENLKMVVQVCTKVEDPAALEEMLPRLLQAVESERGEELEAGRLLELLRRVEGEGGGVR